MRLTSLCEVVFPAEVWGAIIHHIRRLGREYETEGVGHDENRKCVLVADDETFPDQPSEAAGNSPIPVAPQSGYPVS